ncbi:tape measure protein [Acinetobacter guillouiae]|uniref:tape measure protein n=1 Tax=Acinetobacter guillouiae TaxID=106649 RepID=UPI0026E24BC9|nr:tape measure protein [Acinetobacter guillouiae]MDO6646392.1 tape measure protein [Acinetobacter guillouiae]
MAEQRSTLIIEISSEQAARNARALDRELQSIERTGNYATTSMNSMSVAARQLAGYLAGVVTVGTAISKMDMYTGLQNRLKLVTANQNELNQAMKDTFAIAQNTAQAWDSTAQVYQRFAQNAKSLGINLKDAATLTETVSKAISISGGTAASAEAALVQFGQALSSGILRGEEYNSIAEQAGGLRDAIAKGLNISVGDLRNWANEGKLTTDVVIKALKNAKVSVDDLFGKTDFSIGQGFVQLGNAVANYAGELGKSTGISKTMQESLKSLADNLNTVTNIAMIGGAYWLGTYIPALYTSTMAGYGKIKQLTEQTSIQYAAIQAERVAAAQELASAEARVVSTQATLAAIAAEKALEVQRLKEQINSIGRTASITRMAELRRVETQVTAELTVAQNALAASQSRVNAAQNLSMGVGRGLLGVLGGPVGLGLTVAAVAGSYLMLKDSTKDTTATLNLQKGTVSELVEEYSKLDELQKRTTMRELEKQVKSLATSYTVAYSDLSAMIGWLEESGSVSESTAREINKLFKEYNKGKISSSEFATAVNNLSGVQKKHKVEIDELTTAHAKADAEYKKVKTAQQALTNQTSSAIKANKDETDSINLKKKALEESKKAYDSYKSGAFDDIKEMAARAKLQSMGQSDALIEQNLKVLKALNFDPLKTKTPYAQEMFKVADISAKMKEKEDLITQAKKDQTKELERQLKVLQVNEKVKSNAAKYGFENIESKYGILPGLLSGIHMQESRGNANAIGPMTKYGTAKGGFQFLDDTAKRFKLTGSDVFDLGKSAEAAAKYLQILYKKFGSWDMAISAYHAGEGNVEKGTKIGPVNRQYVQNVKGYIAGTNGFDGSTKDFDTSVNDLVKFLQVKQDLELQYSSGEIQRRTEHEKKLVDIQSHFSGDTYTKLERQENERFANENRLAELQFDLNVRGWNWTNEQRIQNEIDTQKVIISLNKEYSDTQKQIAKEEVDEKFAYELEKSKLAKNQRLLQATEFYMSELQLAKARYDIEKKLIAQSNEDPKEKAFKSQMLELQNQVEMNRRLKDTSMGWDFVQSQMNGSNGRFQVSQDRFSRMGASQNLFDTQIADVENQEQEPGADLQKLAEVREQIWAAHNQRMIDIENQYQKDSMNLQLTQAQQLTGSFANMFKGILGESSGAYKTMFAMQQGFALTQAGMNLWSSVSDAYAKEPGTVWQKVAAGAKAALDQGTFLAMIQAITPQGFATGGPITGKGTGTSDDIPIMASNGEFMMRQYAASKIGLVALNYMNQTGEIPFQSEYLAMKSQFLGSTLPDSSTQKFKDGGLVGVTRMSNEDADRRRFNSIPKNSSQGEGSGDIKIEVNITDSGVNTSGGNTQDQRQFAQVVGNAVRAVIIQEKRQGGLLSK